MKTQALALLPLGLLLSSCFSDPYPAQGPPLNRDGSPYHPYGQGSGYESPRPQAYDGPQSESGSYEQLPPQDGGRPYNQAPPVDSTRRPIPPKYDPDDSSGSNTSAPAPTAPERPNYPTAKRTDNPNEVISPYAPYHLINVEGIKSGHLAKDPSTNNIFRVP